MTTPATDPHDDGRASSGDALGDTTDPRDSTASRPPLRPGASIPEIELDVAKTREEFARTLDAIEDKLSVPAHARRLKASVTRRVREGDAKPVVAAAAAGVVGVAAVVAGIIKTARR